MKPRKTGVTNIVNISKGEAVEHTDMPTIEIPLSKFEELLKKEEQLRLIEIIINSDTFTATDTIKKIFNSNKED